MSLALLTRGMIFIGGGIDVSIDRTLDPVLSAIELRPEMYASYELKPEIPQIDDSSTEELIPEILSAEDLVPRVYNSIDLRPEIVAIEEE